MAEDSPSVHGHELWRVTTAEALALVDEKLGPPESWAASALLHYRLSADFQGDWKAEVGHWLHAAKTFGFLDALLPPIFGERRRHRVNPDRTAGDRRHLKLHQHLSEALFAHYFTGLGWSFQGWNTTPGESIDIDLAMETPDGALVELQVKTPDEPGDLVNGQYQGGNSDQRVLESLDHAFEQLPKPARSVAMVGVFAQRDFHLSLKPVCVVRKLLGSTAQMHGDRDVFLERSRFGDFMKGRLNHVAGVVLVDLLRTAEFVFGEDTADVVNRLTYPCTVLLNPNADHPANADWFPRARVLTLEGHTFHWVRGEPPDRHGLPSGTQTVHELPED